jgi:hypothetical protein
MVVVTLALGKIDPALAPFFATLVKNASTSGDRIAVAAFHQAQIEAILALIHLPASSSLSMIAVELLPGGSIFEAAGFAAESVFPFGRILRASPLAPVAPFC